MPENSSIAIIVAFTILLIFVSIIILFFSDARIRSSLFGDKTLVTIVLGTLAGIIGVKGAV